MGGGLDAYVIAGARPVAAKGPRVRAPLSLAVRGAQAPPAAAAAGGSAGCAQGHVGRHELHPVSLRGAAQHDRPGQRQARSPPAPAPVPERKHPPA